MTEMEQLKSLWTNIDQKLDRNWELNLQIIEHANLDKARNKMNNLVWIKAITMGFYGLSTILFVSYAVSRWGVPHQSFTGIIFAVWTLIIFITAIHELSLVLSINYSEAIPVVQEKLIKMKLTTIKYLRLGVWVFPLYFGFIILFFDLLFGVDIVAVGDKAWIISNIIFSILVFIPMAVWMHIKLSAKNANKRWMNKVLGGNGNQINDAMNLLEAIDSYKK